MRELAKQLVEEYQHRDLVPTAALLAPTPMQPQKAGRGIFAVTGVMGSGKSSLLLASAAHLLESGVPRERTLYADLADFRLLAASRHANPLPALIDALMERFPENRRARTHLFLDNVGHIDDWQSFAKGLLDTYDTRITVADARRSWLDASTSSIAAHSLQACELLPAGLSGCLQAHSDKEPLEPEAASQAFLRFGGLPKARLSDNPLDTLHDTAKSALADLTLRYDRSAPVGILAAFLSYALGKTGQPLSLTKAQRELADAGFRTTRNTLKAHLELLEEAHLLYTVSDLRFTNAENPRSPKIVIAGDHGMALAVSPLSRTDADSLAVTLAYLDLRRKGHLGDVFCYRAKAGSPALLACANPSSGNVFSLVGFSTHDSSPKRLRSSLRALAEAQRQTGARKATLLVKESPDEDIGAPDGALKVMTLKEWLLLSDHL